MTKADNVIPLGPALEQKKQDDLNDIWGRLEAAGQVSQSSMEDETLSQRLQDALCLQLRAHGLLDRTITTEPEMFQSGKQLEFFASPECTNDELDEFAGRLLSLFNAPCNLHRLYLLKPFGGGTGRRILFRVSYNPK